MSLFEVGTHDTRHRAASVRPRQAFVLSDFECAESKGTVITEHQVDVRKDQLLIGEGKLLDAVSLANVLASFAVETDGWLPANLLYQSRTRFAWTVPCRRRRMAFALEKKTLLLTVPWPQLLFVARNDGSLQVVALAGGETPHRLTPVFHAPLMNVSGTGELCFGTATRPPFDLASIPAYEEAVFNTRFSHVNHPHTFVGRRGKSISNADHLACWQALHDSKAKDLPRNLLRPMRDPKRFHLTLEQVLRT